MGTGGMLSFTEKKKKSGFRKSLWLLRLGLPGWYPRQEPFQMVL